MYCFFSCVRESTIQKCSRRILTLVYFTVGQGTFQPANHFLTVTLHLWRQHDHFEFYIVAKNRHVISDMQTFFLDMTLSIRSLHAYNGWTYGEKRSVLS